jgi:hypothetical protein
MLAARRLRKPATWAGILCLLLALLYCGAYFRIVSRIYVVEVLEEETGKTIRRLAIPRYTLPWPVPTHFNNGWAHERLDTLFAPMYRFDRRLRPDLWKDNASFVQGPASAEIE